MADYIAAMDNYERFLFFSIIGLRLLQIVGCIAAMVFLGVYLRKMK